MDKSEERSIASDSPHFWISLGSLFIVIMILTMWKDQWLTGNAPNVLFYAIVPLISVLAGSLGMFGFAKLIKVAIAFAEILAIIVCVNLIMQVVEIVLKLAYYLLWEYPGLLYLGIVIPMGFLLGAYGLVRWGRVKWWKATILMMIELVSELVAATILTSLPGLSTPGS